MSIAAAGGFRFCLAVSETNPSPQEIPFSGN
jgi:hypothetical protein